MPSSVLADIPLATKEDLADALRGAGLDHRPPAGERLVFSLGGFDGI